MADRSSDKSPITSPVGTALLDHHALFDTSEVREAASLGAKVFSRHDLRVLQEPNFHAVLGVIDLDGTRLARLTYGADLSVRGEPARQWFGIHVPLRGRLRVRRNGRYADVSPGEVGIFNPQDETDMDWSHDLDLLVLWISRDHLEDRLRSLCRRRRGVLHFPGIKLGNPHVVREMLIAFSAVLGEHPGVPPATLSIEARRAMLSALLLTQEHSSRESLLQVLPKGVSPRVHALIRQIDEDPRGEHSTSVLARRSGLSERTIQHWFHRETGMSPREYVRTARLAGARDALLNIGGTVSSVAVDWGFDHMGRFAGWYRREFGELPRETLAQRRSEWASGALDGKGVTGDT